MPTLTVSVLKETKVLLDALSTLMQAPASRVIDKITTAYVDRLGTQEKQAVDALAEAALTRLAKEPLSGTAGAEPVTTYEFSRLCFKRDVIEALAPQDTFRVITPQGVFQMTKADFHRAFSNVAQSRSYLENGLYHYPKLPARAEEFRIA
jgi:plasmid stabilization system protein ParE